VREDERAVVFTCDRVRDVYRLVELLGGDVVSERASGLGVKWNYLAFHAKSAFLDARGSYFHLNTSLLAHISYHEGAHIRISPLSDR
jgi:hypothetical protein